MDDLSEVELKNHRPSFKKSILHRDESTGSSRRGTSRAQIHWKEVPARTEEERKAMKSSLINQNQPVLGFLMSRGYKWHYIHDLMLKIHWDEVKHDKPISDEIQEASSKTCSGFIQDLGSGIWHKHHNKNAELTFDQQSHLEVLKHKVKAENDAYLMRHPEVDILIKLIYAALYKTQPTHPKEFVADYVHHLNEHREELVIEDVDIPFDQPAVVEETTSEEDERHLIKDFARQIVESCLNLATLGESYVDVMKIINSMLKIVSPSENDLPIESLIASAEAAVSEILTSLLTSVAIQRSTSAELIVDDVLNLILSNALPFVHRDSEVYLEMKESVENFIHRLLEQLLDTSVKNISISEILEEPVSKEGKEQLEEEPTRPILRKEHSFNDIEQREKTKVKFQSI